jgi:hypothetical protein
MGRTIETMPCERFESLARELATREGVGRDHLFGRPTLTRRGHLVAAYLADSMVFRLSGEDRRYALRIPGALAWTWDPSGEQGSQREWVEVPAGQAATWPELARRAIAARPAAGAALGVPTQGRTPVRLAP